MATLDWVVLAVLLVSVLLGVLRGLVYEVLSVLSWLAAFLVAQWLAPDVATMLPMGDTPEPIRYAGGFLVVFIAVVFAGGLLAWLTKKLIEAVGLRPIDRTLGAAFGLARGIVLVLAMAVVIHVTPLKNGVWWTESRTADVATAALRGLQPVLPDRFGKYLPV